MHEAVESLIPAHALGSADPEEARQVAAHVRCCLPCRFLLADYVRLGEELLFAVPLVPAPAHLTDDLRRRLTPPEDIRGRSGRPAWSLSGWGWAALAASLVLLCASNLYWWNRLAAAEASMALQATAIAAVGEASIIRLAGDAPAPGAYGTLTVPTRETVAVLHVYGLPALDPGKVYQVWLIRQGQRDSGGLFTVDARGAGTWIVRAPRPWGEYEAVGVTVEPAGGSQGPTSPRVLGGRL